MTPPGDRRHDVDLTRSWVEDGTRVLVELVTALDDDAFAAPALVPGWSRAHVVAHVARNGEALVRLAGWARTGEENPMYAGAEQREAEIEETSTEPPAELRHLLTSTAMALDQAFDAMGEQGWQAEVRTRHGRTVRGSVLPWLRVREVWLHAVDLDAGPVLDRAPDELVDALLADVTVSLARDPACPAVRLRADDRDESWRLGEAAGTEPVVSGTAAQLLLWLTGRSDGSDLQVDGGGDLPAVPVWL